LQDGLPVGEEGERRYAPGRLRPFTAQTGGQERVVRLPKPRVRVGWIATPWKATPWKTVKRFPAKISKRLTLGDGLSVVRWIHAPQQMPETKKRA
jgi:hypothetical protein